MEIKEINIICVGDIRYRFNMNEIKQFEDNKNIFRIYFSDGSIIDYNKMNIICVEFVKGV